MKKAFVLIVSFLLVAASGVVVVFAQEVTPVDAPDEFVAVFGSYAEDEFMFDVQIYNRTDGAEIQLVTVEDVYTSHYHFYEVHNGVLYIIKRVGDLETDDWMDELWRYSPDAEGELLFSAQGFDFRVAPDESYIALRYDLPPDYFYGALGFLDLAGGEIVQEFPFEDVDERVALSLETWTTDATQFWVSFKGGPTPFFFAQVEVSSWAETIYEISDLIIGHEYDLNPELAQLIYSDYPTFFDAMSAQAFAESEETVTLYHYDFDAQAVQAIAESMAKSFDPRWLVDTLIGFEDPDSDARVTYDLAVGAFVEAYIAGESAIFPAEIPAGFEMPLQALVLSGVPVMLPAEFPVEAGLPAVAPYISYTDEGIYELSLDYGADCGGAGACRYGGMMGRAATSDRPGGTENIPFDYWSSQQVILPGGIQGYFVESQCGASCSDAQIFWLYDGYEYMVGLKSGIRADVLALAEAMIANSLP